jgi:molybdenum cofactor cytidylyltransferase
MPERVAAVVLAAGLSRRMGRPKMVLPWGETTVVGQVTAVLLAAGAQPVVVVTGGAVDEVTAALRDQTVRLVYNPEHANGEMLDSLRAGLRGLEAEISATLMALGDQPFIQPEVVRAIMARYAGARSRLIVPSFQLRRGHPWLIDRALWGELIAMPPGETMRDFLRRHADEIDYLNVETPSVIQDLDTPEDYAQSRPE